MKKNNELDNFEIKKSYKWIYILIIIILLFDISYYFINNYLKNNNSKKVFIDNIKEMYNFIYEETPIKEIKNNKNISMNIEIVNNINIKNERIKNTINNIDLSLKYLKKDKFHNLEINTEYLNQTLLNYALNIRKNNIYIDLKDNYKNPILLNKSKNINIDNDNKTNTILKDTFIKHFKEVNFTLKKVLLDEEKVKIITIDNLNKITEKFFNDLIYNDEFINSIGTNESKQKIIKKLAQIRDYLKDFSIDMYTDIFTNKLLKIDIIINKDKITLTKEKNELNFKYFKDNIILFDTILKLEKNKISILYNQISNELEINTIISYEIDTSKDIEIKEITNSIPLDEVDVKTLLKDISKDKNIAKFIIDLKENN